MTKVAPERHTTPDRPPVAVHARSLVSFRASATPGPRPRPQRPFRTSPPPPRGEAPSGAAVPSLRGSPGAQGPHADHGHADPRVTAPGDHVAVEASRRAGGRTGAPGRINFSRRGSSQQQPLPRQ